MKINPDNPKASTAPIAWHWRQRELNMSLFVGSGNNSTCFQCFDTLYWTWISQYHQYWHLATRDPFAKFHYFLHRISRMERTGWSSLGVYRCTSLSSTACLFGKFKSHVLSGHCRDTSNTGLTLLLPMPRVLHVQSRIDPGTASWPLVSHWIFYPWYVYYSFCYYGILWSLRHTLAKIVFRT